MINGKKRMILGVILIFIQILGLFGSLIDGASVFSSAMSLSYLIGYFSFGIVGVILFLWGMSAGKKSR